LIKFLDDTTPQHDGNGHQQEGTNSAYSRRHPFLATLTCNRRITSEAHFQDVRHLELDISGSGIRFDPGDIAVIQPENLPERVQEVIEFLGFTEVADRPLTITPNKDVGAALPAGWSVRSTIRELLTKHLDLFGVPRRYFFELLSFLAADPAERDKLREFVSAEGQQDLFNYCNRMRRTTFEVLHDFRSLKIPPESLCDLFLPLQPRSFSISSSPSASPALISLTVAIVFYRTKMSKPRTGVCTAWLSALEQGVQVPLWIDKGTMALPKESQVPIITIGPGTGFAPFRSFLQERAALGASSNVLFFGCRSREADYFYETELEAMVAQRQLTLFVAFSRDTTKKVYVQHEIIRNATLVWDLIQRGAVVFLSG